MGRLDPMKGHDTFIKAGALLSQERADVGFVCVGDGPKAYKARLVALTQEVGMEHKLVWMEAGHDAAAIYNALDILTSCSSYGEGFSNVIAEAMACGRPCVVSDVGDAKVIVGDDGVVVPPEDPRALCEAWKTVLDLGEERRAELGRRARARIVEQFALEHLVDATSEVLKKP